MYVFQLVLSVILLKLTSIYVPMAWAQPYTFSPSPPDSESTSLPFSSATEVSINVSPED